MGRAKEPKGDGETAAALAPDAPGAEGRPRSGGMRKRVLIGVLMILAGLGLLLPPAWTLFSPFLLALVGSSSGAGVTWLLATFGGMALLVMGVRRMLPFREPS